jgi:hypothetical protein
MPHADNALKPVWASFNANLGSLWLFAEEIGKLADTQDRAATSQMARNLARFFNQDPEAAELEFQQLIPANDGDVEFTPDQLAKIVLEMQVTLNSSDTRQSVAEWVRQNPAKAADLKVFLRAEFSNLPAHGKILRRGALMMLVTFLENLVARLTELRPAEGARGRQHDAGEPATESAGHGVMKQIDHLSRSLKGDARYLDHLRADLEEIVARRNLFVHNNGIVGARYLKRVPQHDPAASGISRGCLLQVQASYLARALDTVQLFGSLLTQLCWRQWRASESNQAGRDFSDFVYDVLAQRRVGFVVRIAAHPIALRLANGYRDFVRVNHAIAARDMGRLSDVPAILKQCDQWPRPLAIEISLHILREEYLAAYDLLRHARETGKIAEISKNWPLFRPIRQDPQFLELFDSASAGSLSDVAP